MKKLFSMILLLTLVAFGFQLSAKAKDKVKIYLFVAGGCPYCELEEEYLKSLDGYGTKFEIVEKELYVDHIDWERGKDYELGYKVATAFQEAGFEDASYQGTPFVVISDIYAAAGYSTSLESYIDQAYEEGDNDVVGAFAKGKTPSIGGTSTDKGDGETKSIIICVSVFVIALVGTIFLIKPTAKKTR